MLGCDRCRRRERGVLALLIRRPEWLPRLAPELRVDAWAADLQPIFQAVLGTALSGEPVTPDNVLARVFDPSTRQTLKDLLQDDVALSEALCALGQKVESSTEGATSLVPDGLARHQLITGSEGLDGITGGLTSGDLVLITSHIGALAGSVGLELVSGIVTASVYGVDVLVASRAIERRELALRLIASGTPGAARLLVPPSDLAQATVVEDAAPIRLLDGWSLSCREIEQAARASSRLDVMAVLGADELGERRGLAATLHDLKRLATALDVAVIATACASAVRLRHRYSAAGAADLVLSAQPSLEGGRDGRGTSVPAAQVDVLWNRRRGRGSFVQPLSVGRV